MVFSIETPCAGMVSGTSGGEEMMQGGIIMRLTVSGGFGTVCTLSHMCERFPTQKDTTTLTDHTAELYDPWPVRINE